MNVLKGLFSLRYSSRDEHLQELVKTSVYRLEGTRCHAWTVVTMLAGMYGSLNSGGGLAEVLWFCSPTQGWESLALDPGYQIRPHAVKTQRIRWSNRWGRRPSCWTWEVEACLSLTWRDKHVNA